MLVIYTESYYDARIHEYKKKTDAQYLKFILFWNNTLHALNGLSAHHQEFKTVHTALYHTASVAACYQGATEPVWYDAVCRVLDS